MGELPVALVVGGHGHDGSGAVAHHDIVGNKDGHHLAGQRVHGGQALDLEAGLFLGQLGALEFGFLGAHIAVRFDIRHIGDLAGVLIDERMLGRHDHEGHAEQGVGPGGVNFHGFVRLVQRELDERAGRFSDPVDLLLLDVFGIIHMLQAFQQLVGVLGDAQIPHILGQLHHVAVADVALAALAVLVGKHHLAGGAVVHQGLVPEHHAVFKQLQENPLGPLVIVGIGGVHFAAVIEGEAQLLELHPEVVDVLLGHDGGMDVVLDGIVLRGQAESVPADGEQHVITLHPAHAGNNVHGRVGAGMPHVQAVAGGIREFDQGIKLGLGMILRRGKSLVVVPVFLPLGFNLSRYIGLDRHCESLLQSLRIVTL